MRIYQWLSSLLVVMLLTLLLPIGILPQAQANTLQSDYLYNSVDQLMPEQRAPVDIIPPPPENIRSVTTTTSRFESDEEGASTTLQFTHRYWDGELSASSTIFQTGDTQIAFPGPDDEIRVIVQLRGDPLATRMRHIMPAPRSLSSAHIALVRAYQHILENTQRQVLSSLMQQGCDVQVHHQYTYLINALALSIKYGDWERLERVPGVTRVYRDYQAQIALTDSVPLVGAPAVWQMTDGNALSVTGQGMRVAIIDTGIDYTHPDLGGCFGAGCKVVAGYDFVNNDADPLDDNGHGTHVAGIVAANGTLLGVAPGAELLAYKVCDANGGCWNSDIIAALHVAADPDNNPVTPDAVDVANLSLGGPGDPDDPLSQAVDAAVVQGIVVVVAAGNSGPSYQTISSPGVARQALTVAASDKQDNIAGFSSRGPVPGFYDVVKPDITAPGVNIVSTVPLAGNLGHPSGYLALGGTSMATPHVAGAAALLKQLYPAWTPAMIKDALMNTARDLGQSVHLQGAGRLDILAAATDQIVIEPPSLGLGLVSTSLPVWSVSRTVTVTNHANAPRSFTVSTGGNFPAGATVTLTPQNFSLNAGEAQTVAVVLTVDNAVVPNASPAPYTYEDDLIVTSGTQTWKAPLMFIKSSAVTFVFDEAPWVLWIHDRQGQVQGLAYPSNPLTLLLAEGTWDAMALYQQTDTRVFKENMVVPPEGITIPFNKSDAIYQVNILPVDETGQTVVPNDYREYCAHKDSLIGYTLSGPFYATLYLSPVSDAYTWQWLASTAGYNVGPIYDFNGYVHDGLSSDLTFANTPGDLKHQRYDYSALASTITEVAVLHVLSGSSNAGAIYFSHNPPLERPFVRDVYSMVMPPDFYWKYHYEEVFIYPGGYPYSGWEGEFLLRTPYLSVTDPHTLSGYHLYRYGPVFTTQADEVHFGLTPPHWAGTWSNSPTQAVLYSASGVAPYVYLNQRQEYRAAAAPEYRLYRAGALMEEGVLDAWNWDCGMCVPFSLPAPDAYTLVIPAPMYTIGAMPGAAQATLDFDTALPDPNPPTLYALNILNAGELTTLIPAMSTEAAVYFEIGDDVGVSNVTLAYATNSVWQGLNLQSAPLAHATAYTAALPSLLPGIYALRLTAVDTSGNQLVYEMNPAFITSGVPVYVPPATQTLAGVQLTIPIILDEDVTGLGLDSYAFTLTFDPEILTPVTVDTAGTRSADWTVLPNFNIPGQARIVGYHSADLNGSGTLVNLVFDVNGIPGEVTPLVFTTFVFNEGSPAALTQNGVVEILAAPVSVSGQIRYYQHHTPVPDVTLSFVGTDSVGTFTDANGGYSVMILPGSYTATPAKIGAVNDALSALDASLAAQYDAGLIGLTAEQQRACDVSGDAACTAHDAANILKHLVALPTSYPVATWRFDPVQRVYPDLNSELTGEDYQAYLLGDVSASWPSGDNLLKSTNQTTVSITSPTTPTHPGQIVTGYLEVSDLSALQLVGFHGYLEYDPAVLTPLASPLVQRDTLSQNWTVIGNALEDGTLRFASYDTHSLAGPGRLLGFSFTVNASAEAVTTELRAALRLNEAPWQTLTGQVQIGKPEFYLYLPLVMRARP